MLIFLTIVHITACFLMVAVILLQSGKGAEIGAAFGGSSQTLFGGRGAATFMSKMTAGAAIVFFVTALSLAVLSKERYVSSSVIEFQGSQQESGEIPFGELPLVPSLENAGQPSEQESSPPAAATGEPPPVELQ